MKILLLLLIISACSKNDEDFKKIQEQDIADVLHLSKINSYNFTYRLTTEDDGTVDCKDISHLDLNNERDPFATRKLDGSIRLDVCKNGFAYTLHDFRVMDKKCFFDCQTSYNADQSLKYTCYEKCSSITGSNNKNIVISIEAP